jgi:hypothetical protein
MNMSTRTRVGKVARLPKDIREELNTRLENGEQGKELVEWLNQSPAVKKVLAAQFGGSPITDNNVSEWKQGGYQDWLKHTEACELVRDLVEKGGELGKAADGTPIGDRLANLLAVELTHAVQLALSQDGGAEERWSQLQEMLRAVSRLRRDDHEAARTLIKQKKWDWEFRLILQKGRKENPMFG